MSNQNENQKKDIGAVWQRASKSGLTYYTGKVTFGGKELSFVMFKNDHKEAGSKQPDWRIYESTLPAPQTNAKPSAPNTAPVRAAQAPAPAPVRAPARRAPAPPPVQEPVETEEVQQESTF